MTRLRLYVSVSGFGTNASAISPISEKSSLAALEQVANILTLLGHLAHQQRDYERAKGRYRESLAIYQQMGNATYTAWCLEGIADVACAQGS